jgi:hypothetical protein
MYNLHVTANISTLFIACLLAFIPGNNVLTSQTNLPDYQHRFLYNKWMEESQPSFPKQQNIGYLASI